MQVAARVVTDLAAADVVAAVATNGSCGRERQRFVARRLWITSAPPAAPPPSLISCSNCWRHQDERVGTVQVGGWFGVEIRVAGFRVDRGSDEVTALVDPRVGRLGKIVRCAATFMSTTHEAPASGKSFPAWVPRPG
jgi:hypothetical protein